MVQPMDAQNMIGRTPLVEKTVAAHRENAPQLHAQADQMKKARLHEDENVQMQREKLRTEKKEKESEKRREEQSKGDQRDFDSSAIELVQEPADSPAHKLDVDV